MNAPKEAPPSHGNFSIGEGILHSPNPTVHTVGLIILALAAAVLAVAVADLLMRGRFRTTSLALATMLIAVAPLLSLYAASDVVFSSAIRASGPSTATTFSLAKAAAEAAFSLSLGAAVGIGAAVVAAVLKIVPIQPRSTNP